MMSVGTTFVLALFTTPAGAEHRDPYQRVDTLAHNVHSLVHELCDEVKTHLSYSPQIRHLVSDLEVMEGHARNMERLVHHRANRHVLKDSVGHLKSLYRHLKYTLKHSDDDMFFRRNSRGYGLGMSHSDHVGHALHELHEHIHYLEDAIRDLPRSRHIRHGSHAVIRRGVGHVSHGHGGHRNQGVTVRLGNFAFRF